MTQRRNVGPVSDKGTGPFALGWTAPSQFNSALRP